MLDSIAVLCKFISQLTEWQADYIIYIISFSLISVSVDPTDDIDFIRYQCLTHFLLSSFHI